MSSATVLRAARVLGEGPEEGLLPGASPSDLGLF
ncbi:hypothetical protein QFZ61_001049 [Arthrobacter sp. B3I4]|nr:hypothetical protein [Arthrobacter sp. B3I4]